MRNCLPFMIPALLLSACLEHPSTADGKLQAQPPPDARVTADGSLIAVGRVVHIADGDTLTVIASNQQTYKIRLQGIDAPEHGQPHAQKCKENLMMLTANLPVTVETYKQDRYGRIVAKITANHQDVALEQLRSGCAWHYKAYAREQTEADREAYAEAEQQARAARRGLWRDKQPVAPWDYRHRKH